MLSIVLLSALTILAVSAYALTDKVWVKIVSGLFGVFFVVPATNLILRRLTELDTSQLRVIGAIEFVLFIVFMIVNIRLDKALKDS